MPQTNRPAVSKLLFHCFVFVFSVGTGMLCFNKRFGCIEGGSILNIKYLEDIFDATDKDVRSFGLQLYRFFPTPLYRKFERAADHLFGY